MKKGYILLAILLFYAPLRALLPPLWEDVDQLNMILEDRRLGEFLSSGDAILNIERKDQGWLIETNHHAVFIKVIHEKQETPGKAHYSLEFVRQ